MDVPLKTIVTADYTRKHRKEKALENNSAPPATSSSRVAFTRKPYASNTAQKTFPSLRVFCLIVTSTWKPTHEVRCKHFARACTTERQKSCGQRSKMFFIFRVVFLSLPFAKYWYSNPTSARPINRQIERRINPVIRLRERSEFGPRYQPAAETARSSLDIFRGFFFPPYY